MPARTLPPPTAPACASSPTVALQLFGSPTTWVNGHESPIALKRAYALLAYLAFHPGAVPRAHLATLLWPDASEAQARTRLRRLVYTLEESLGASVLDAIGDGLAVMPRRLETDAQVFAQFARGLVAAGAMDADTLAQSCAWIDRARRPLLQGIDIASSAFDDWRQATTIAHEHLLARLLERVVDALAQRGEFDPALELAESLIALDVYREPSYVLLMQLHARQGHRAGVETVYARCADTLRAEFGIAPGPQTEEAYQRITDDLKRLMAHRVERPTVRFAEGDTGAIAYAVVGTGRQTLVLCPGFVSHIELALEYPPLRAIVHTLSAHFQVVLFDRRGLGLSERLRAASTPQALADDIAAILDHAGIARAWLFGSSEGGLGAMRFAIEHPQRTLGLCLFGALARGSAAPDYPWALPAPAYGVWLKRLVAGWGGPAGIETFAPSQKDDPALRAWWARLVRHAASPGGLETILAGLRDADLRADLGRIQAPTLVMHRRGDRAVRFEAGEHLAQAIPGAQWQPLEGTDHFWWCGDSESIVRALLKFAGG